MHIQKFMAMLAICGWLFSTAPTTDAAADTTSDLRAAKRQKMMAGGGSIQGIVIDHHKKAVAGATVRTVHSLHHKAHSAANKPAAKAANVKKPGAKHHNKSTAITGAGGTFTLKSAHGGAHLLKAHKKGVGSGHAMAMVGGKKAARVVIRLHKHHHHHSGVKAKK